MDNVQYEVRYIVFETLYWSVFENSYYKSETGETKHMIKIAIVEDEAMYAKQLQDFLRQYETENGEAFDITIYSDGDQIVHKYKSQFDIILMDVEMKFMDGMSAAEEIRKIDTEVVIIFITNMAQYAIRGYAVDALYHRREEHNPRICHEEHCHDGCGCSCNSEESFLKNVLKRTASVWIFLFLASLALGLAIEFLGEETLRRFLLTDSVFQPFLTGLVGLIPNCAPSAILAQMYLEGTVGFGAVVSGLCSAAGMGMLVLFRTNKNMKENFTVLGLTYGIGVFSGVILSLIFR